MQIKKLSYKNPGMILLPGLVLLTFALLGGCGTGEGVSISGGTEADQNAILQAVNTDPFFVESVTDMDVDEEASAAAGAQIFNGQVSIQSLSAESGSAELPRFWWRGDLEPLGRKIDIHIENGVADVRVVHDVAGTFFIVDDAGDALVLWGKPFEDLVTRHARFTQQPWGWTLTAISPVEFGLPQEAEQTVFVDSLRAYTSDGLVWETTEPSALYTISTGLPTFSTGEELRVEADVHPGQSSGWTPSQFVFLHHPGPNITGRRTRDIMFDNGTNGDLTEGDGTYTRLFTVGPRRGRHFAAVDVIDAPTFTELEAPYNSGAWGMPYIVE